MNLSEPRPLQALFTRLGFAPVDAPEEQQRFEAWARAGSTRVLIGIAALLCGSILLLWPLDRLVFHEREIVRAYDLWRPVVAGMTAVTALACALVPAARRRTYLVSIAVAGVAMAFSTFQFTRFGGLEGPFPYLAYDFQFMLVPVLVSLRARVAGSLWLNVCFLAGMILRSPAIVHDRYFAFFILAGALVDFANVVFGHIVYRLAWRNFVQRRDLEKQRAKLAEANEKSERLLLNILPAPIAERLKEQPAAIADRFGEVTVLFADICQFTPLSESMSPEALVKLLNEIFTDFDARVQQLGLEKIKTIGDAYMVAGGLPAPRADHAEAVCTLALDMLEAVSRRHAPAERPLRLRIGIHSGPVVAGVIGQMKFSYDLWGDTVNTASRMESHGVPGTITVSETTRQLLGDRFAFEDRGLVQVKGKGEMRLFVLTGRAAARVPAA